MRPKGRGAIQQNQRCTSRSTMARRCINIFNWTAQNPTSAAFGGGFYAQSATGASRISIDRPILTTCFAATATILSYESAQSSRKKSEKFFQALARDLDSTTRQARSWLRVTHPGGAVHEVKRPVGESVRDRRTGIALMVTKLAREQGLSI